MVMDRSSILRASTIQTHTSRRQVWKVFQLGGGSFFVPPCGYGAKRYFDPVTTMMSPVTSHVSPASVAVPPIRLAMSLATEA